MDLIATLRLGEVVGSTVLIVWILSVLAWILLVSWLICLITIIRFLLLLFVLVQNG